MSINSKGDLIAYDDTGLLALASREEQSFSLAALPQPTDKAENVLLAAGTASSLGFTTLLIEQAQQLDATMVVCLLMKE